MERLRQNFRYGVQSSGRGIRSEKDTLPKRQGDQEKHDVKNGVTGNQGVCLRDQSHHERLKQRNINASYPKPFPEEQCSDHETNEIEHKHDERTVQRNESLDDEGQTGDTARDDLAGDQILFHSE